MYAKVMKPIKYIGDVIEYCVDYISISDESELLKCNEWGYIILWVR